MEKEKLEYYMIKPNLKQIYGKKVNKSTKFEEKTEDGRIKQKFENLTLTTIIDNNLEQDNFKIKEHSEVSVEVPEGTILIWNEQEGFIIPQIQITTLTDLKKELEDMKEIYKDSNIGE